MSESIYTKHKPAGSDGLYLKLTDGESAKVRIASEPAIFESVGERDGKPTITTRYAWVVWNQDKQKAQIWQSSATFFKTLAAYASNPDWGDPDQYDITITRSGANFNDTTYTVAPSPNKSLLDITADNAAEEIDLIKNLESSPFSQRVSWLKDWDESLKAKVRELSKQMPKPDTTRPSDELIPSEFLDDDPVNLDDIPF